MKIWIDTSKPAPANYLWYREYWDALKAIRSLRYCGKIEVINIGDDDGHAIEVIGLLAKMGLKYPIRIHSANPIEIDKLRRAIVENRLEEVDPRKSVCIWVDHEANEPDEFYRVDTVNKVKNCVLWCEEHKWPIGCIDAVSAIEKSREADGGTILDLLSWLKDTGRYYLFRRH